jgi:hypothetical protein
MSTNPSYEKILDTLQDLVRGKESLSRAVQHLARGVHMLTQQAPPCARCLVDDAGQICPHELSDCPYCGLRGHIEEECETKHRDELWRSNADNIDDVSSVTGPEIVEVDSQEGYRHGSPDSPQYSPESYPYVVSSEYVPDPPMPPVLMEVQEIFDTPLRTPASPPRIRPRRCGSQKDYRNFYTSKP